MSDTTNFLKNPWKNVPQTPPYILKNDFDALRQYQKGPENLGWRTELLPVPFLGDYQKASIIILCLNPGFIEKMDIRDYGNKYYFQENIRSLTMKSHSPFFCLDPKISFSGGYLWWTKILNHLINKFGIEHVSQKLMCLQYLAYHSKTYTNPPCLLPSQNYTFSLLKLAIKEQKTIVVMRSKKLWLKAVPELETCPYLELKNYRRPFLSEGNMNKEDFEVLIKSLEI